MSPNPNFKGISDNLNYSFTELINQLLISKYKLIFTQPSSYLIPVILTEIMTRITLYANKT